MVIPRQKGYFYHMEVFDVLARIRERSVALEPSVTLAS